MAKQKTDTTKLVDTVVLLLSSGRRIDDAKQLCQDKFNLVAKQANKIVEKAVDRIKRNSDVCIEWELGKTIELYDSLYKKAAATKEEKQSTIIRLQHDVLKTKTKLLLEIKNKFYNENKTGETDEISIAQLESLGRVLGLETKGIPIAESIRMIEISVSKMATENERLKKRAASKLRNP